LVYGHVDAAGEVSKVTNNKDGVTLEVSIPENLTRYMVYKGSIAVNGVSLTLVTVSSDSFTVSLIPYTLEHSNLSELKKGSLVNIEVDMFAKHVEKLVRK
jgi:riboflavin synthase